MSRSFVIGEGDSGTCIYCGGDATTARRMAHVYPVALFDNDVVLPPGVECDSCNEFCGTLERELLSHNRIGPFIVLRGVPGRDGKIRQQIGTIRRDSGTGDVRLSGVAKVTEATRERLSVELPDILPLDEGRFRRALHHIGLNHLALVAGAPLAREPRFDRVRRFVRYGDPHAPWHYAQSMCPDDQIQKELGCSYLRNEPGTKIRIRTFLDNFFVDLEASSDLGQWARQVLPAGTGVL